MIADILAATCLACAALSLVFMAMYLVFLRLHVSLRPRGLEEERRLLSLPIPAEQNLPHVVVQIASFNEGDLVRRAAEAAVALDWPTDRLHIQLCDDSTDGTIGIARDAAASLRARGFDVIVLHRADREGYKAGALMEAVEATGHDFFAIFDADYLPAPDFLRRCMPVLLDDPTVSFVQARIDYLNRDENALTRAQALLFDHHTGVDQPTRSWGRHVLPFNGTCGIWRRAAIEAAGHWRGDTLAEDLDLSYRAWMAGFHGEYLLSVTVPGELPTSFRAWSSQQRRWTKGFSQVAYRVLGALFTSRVSGLRNRVVVFTHLSPVLLAPASALATATGVGLIVVRPEWWPWLVALAVLLNVLGYSMALFGMLVARRTLHGTAPKPPHFARSCARALAMRYYVDLLSSYYTVRDLLSRRPAEFVRTPKGSVIRSG